MTGNLLNLPINIPWKQIAVSPDMIDQNFCNKLFPFAWRSSMAISVYEPDPDDLPEELCGDRITYLKITTTITGYQPFIPNHEEFVTFPDTPTEDFRDVIDRIKAIYFACYGVLLNVAVFPYPNTKKELIERGRIDFANLQIEGSPPLAEGEKLPNPLKHSGVTFEATGQQANELINIIQLGEGTDAELNLFEKMEIALDGYAAVEAKVVCANSAGVKMEAFSSGKLVGTEETEAQPNEVTTLLIEAEDIDRVVISAPENEASLLEFAWYGAREVPVELEDYPHVIDFEPEVRDLYQAATETGEILTASNSGVATDKSLTNTKHTETGLELATKITAGTEDPETGGKFEGENSGKLTHKWGEINTDQYTVQTDASRERRETQGTTTQLSQMYNLLTGYHKGTNRAVFLMLARPHVLQPTDFRTFVQGLRAIEGVQEFFLIIARPESIDGLCIETSLETGHFPEDTPIIEPPVQYNEIELDYIIKDTAKGAGSLPGQGAECKNIEAVRTLPAGWVADQRPERMRQAGDPVVGSGWDPGYPGVAHLEQEVSPLPSSFNYEVTDGALKVSGTICGDGHDFLGFGSGDDNDFHQTFRVFLRSEKPVKTYQEPYADIGRLLVTSRGLCTCFKSGDCPEVVSVSVPVAPEEPPPYVESIVDEPMLRMNKALLTKEATSQTRSPAMKEFLRGIQTALTTSFRSPKRYPFGEVGFLESDYFKDEIKKLLPERYLQTPLSQVKGLPAEVAKALGDDLTIDQALKMDLARFARRTGLNIEEAARARRRLLGLTNDIDDDVSTDSARKYGESSK